MTDDTGTNIPSLGECNCVKIRRMILNCCKDVVESEPSKFFYKLQGSEALGLGNAYMALYIEATETFSKGRS